MLNRFLGGLSGISGVGMFIVSALYHDTATALSSVGAVAMAVVLFQIADTRERVARIESILLNGNTHVKGKSARR